MNSRTGRLALETGCMYSFMSSPRCFWLIGARRPCALTVVGDRPFGGLPDGAHERALLLFVKMSYQTGAAGDQREAAQDLRRYAHVAQGRRHRAGGVDGQV